MELVVVDNASPPASQAWLDSWSADRPDVRVVRFPTRLGYAAARNAGVRWARGYAVVLLDTSVELTGDAFGPLLEILRRAAVGAAGAWGVRTHDLRRFNESEEVEVDALEGYCFAFLRERLREIGFMDEKFKYYRNCDLDYSFAFRARGYRLCRVAGLPLIRHEHRGWTSLPEAERDRLSKRNFYRFLDKWRDRTDLLVGPNAPGSIAAVGVRNRG
jgi:cysteinyl-tRNA synthetase